MNCIDNNNHSQFKSMKIAVMGLWGYAVTWFLPKGEFTHVLNSLL